MADISKITLPSGNTYDIKDAVAREQMAGGIHFRGVTTTELTDGSATNPITINGQSYTAQNGDLVIYSYGEFIFSSDDNKWHQFGDTSELGALAYKDNVSTTIKPEGTVSTPDITVVPATETAYVAGSATGGGSVTNGTAASAVMPVLETTVQNETLTLSWTAGSFTANTPTAVTLPTFSSKTVATGITSATSSQPTFTGTQKAYTGS